jgi:hypothetical protein
MNTLKDRGSDPLCSDKQGREGKGNGLGSSLQIVRRFCHHLKPHPLSIIEKSLNNLGERCTHFLNHFVKRQALSPSCKTNVHPMTKHRPRQFYHVINGW